MTGHPRKSETSEEMCLKRKKQKGNKSTTGKALSSHPDQESPAYQNKRGPPRG